MNYFKYDGQASNVLGLWIEHRPVITTARRVVESITVPGRNGSLLFDTGAYENVTVTYQVAYKDGGQYSPLYSIASWIAEWLNQGRYCTLEDTYYPTIVRKAVFVSPLNVTDILGVAGRANITFSCKPQKYIKSSQSAIPNLHSGDTLYYSWAGSPIITTTGNGTVLINGTSVKVTGATGSVVINCEDQTIEQNGTNASSLVTLTNGFPSIVIGNNTFSWTGFTSVSVIPNVWTL